MPGDYLFEKNIKMFQSYCVFRYLTTDRLICWICLDLIYINLFGKGVQNINNRGCCDHGRTDILNKVNPELFRVVLLEKKYICKLKHSQYCDSDFSKKRFVYTVLPGLT